MKNFRLATTAILAALGVALPALADDTPLPGAKREAVQTKGATRPEPAVAPSYHPEPAAARQANVNIRAQARLNSEIVGHLKKGEAVTILEEVNSKKAKQDEPSRWFRIIVPSAVGVWVHSSFLADGAVKATRLNLRSGPGEEYTVLGRIEKGTAVKTLETKGDWTKIEAPTNAHAFVAAHLLEKTPITTPPVIVPEPPKTNEIAAIPTKVETVTTPTPPVVPEPPTNAVPVTPVVTTPPAETNVPPVIAPLEPLPEAPVEKVKKIVNREGILKGSVSIQAPTYYELRSLDTGKTINYVFSPSTNLVLKEFKGQRIIVTGEELLDERWQNTPVIIVDALQSVP